MYKLTMLQVIHIVESELGLSYTMIVLAASLVIFFAILYIKYVKDQMIFC